MEKAQNNLMLEVEDLLDENDKDEYDFAEGAAMKAVPSVYLFLTDYLFIICPTPRIADGKQINKQKKNGKYFRHCRLSIVC